MVVTWRPWEWEWELRNCSGKAIKLKKFAFFLALFFVFSLFHSFYLLSLLVPLLEHGDHGKREGRELFWSFISWLCHLKIKYWFKTTKNKKCLNCACQTIHVLKGNIMKYYSSTFVQPLIFVFRSMQKNRIYA